MNSDEPQATETSLGIFLQGINARLRLYDESFSLITLEHPQNSYHAD